MPSKNYTVTYWTPEGEEGEMFENIGTYVLSAEEHKKAAGMLDLLRGTKRITEYQIQIAPKPATYDNLVNALIGGAGR